MGYKSWATAYEVCMLNNMATGCFSAFRSEPLSPWANPLANANSTIFVSIFCQHCHPATPTTSANNSFKSKEDFPYSRVSLYLHY